MVVSTSGPGRDIMTLKDTYANMEIHAAWESVYRSNTLQNNFNDLMMNHIMTSLHLPSGALLLDAGCGRGDHSIRIVKKGYRCVSVDISEHVLRNAAISVAACDLRSKVSFATQALEDLSFREGTFDAVYCRGVLMHIPNWTKALSELCRVLKPGGKIVIVESNNTSLEARIVVMIRHLMATKSRLIHTSGGFEFWSDEHSRPFLVRIANIRHLIKHLNQRHVITRGRFATEFWDINRFPSGVLRNAIIRFNRLWFSLRLPCSLSAGNVVIGEKTTRPESAAVLQGLWQ